MRRRRLLSAKPLVFVAAALASFSILVTGAGAAAPSAVTDVNPVPAPPIEFGGRVEALAVDPVNAQNVYAAGELGGFWHSTDQGLHWSHVDDLPHFVTRDIEFAPSDSSLLIATGDYDGRVASQGGIWRSTDGGATWSKPATADPGCTGEPSAFGAAIAPNDPPGSIRIWVGTSCGIAYSTNSGASWTHFSPSGLAGRVWDTYVHDPAGAEFDVYACGDNGYRRSTTGGATAGSFTDGVSPIPADGGMPCSLATAPQDEDTVYMSYFDSPPPPPSQFCTPRVAESTDGGTTWEEFDPTHENCRNPYVVTHPALDGNADHYEVFIGDGRHLHHQNCDATAAARCAPGNASWPDVGSGAHADHTDIAFDTSSPNGCPILVSNDGGIDRTTVAPASCASTFAWADSNAGNHGWDIRGLAGTVDVPGGTELYFGTQDNGIYYSPDGGVSWPLRTGPDVYDVFADHNGPARVLWRSCFGCAWNISGPGITGTGGFSLPPGDDVPNSFVATQFGHQRYAFITRNAPPPSTNWRLWVTTNEGGAWSQMGPNPLPGTPAGPLVASGPAASPTFYTILNVSGTRTVYRISGPFTAAATVTAVSTGLTSPTIVAVDPVNPNLLYAWDNGSPGRIMRSINGGSSWTADADALSVATRNGEFKALSSIGGIVSKIAFDENSDTLMIGTRTAGVLGSADNGDTWFYVRGSEILPRINGFLFDESDGSIFVATRGRGLWRINPPSADLRVTKSDNPDPVLAGNELYYTITVTNDGPDTASDITVTDTLPPEVDFVTSTNPSCAAVGQVVTCDVPDLDSGDTFQFTIKVAVKTGAALPAPKAIFNTVQVSSGETLDPDLSNNTDTEATIVEDLADLEVTKLCKPDTHPQAGQPIECSIFVDNHGPSDARDVILTDTLLAPGSFTISNIVASQGSCGLPFAVTGGQRFVCNLGDLQAATTSQSGRATVTYTVSSSEGQDINNVANVQSDTPDPDPSNNQVTVALNVSSVADLSLTKTDAPDPVTAGTNITWTLSLGNGGPSTASNVLVEDTVPLGVSITSVSGTGGASCTTGVAGDPLQPAKCTWGSLAPGAPGNRTMTIQAKVLSGTKGTLENNARISSDTFDANNTNDLASSSTTVIQSADLALDLSSDEPSYKPSSTIHYKVTVNNNGPSDAEGVVVTVQFPPLSDGSYVSDDGDCTLSAATLTCDLDTLVAGEPTTTIFIDWAMQGNKFPASTTATVSSPTPDPVPGNNGETLVVTKK